MTVGIYIFNRIWKFGKAEYRVSSAQSWEQTKQTVELEYIAPVLPFMGGKFRTPRIMIPHAPKPGV